MAFKIIGKYEKEKRLEVQSIHPEQSDNDTKMQGAPVSEIDLRKNLKRKHRDKPLLLFKKRRSVNI